MKKIEKRRDSNYYAELVETVVYIGEAKGIKTEDFYEVIAMVDEKLGYKPSQASKILGRLKTILGSSIVTEVDTEVHRRGKGKPEIITFLGSAEELKKKILDKAEDAPVEKKEKEVVVVPEVKKPAERKIVGRDTLRTRPTENSVKRLYDILSLYISKKKTYLGFYEIKEALGINMNAQIMKDIMSCLGKYGYHHLSYGIADAGKGKKSLKIDSAESALLELSVKYKLWFGIEKSLEVEKLLGISKAIKLPAAKKVEVVEISKGDLKPEHKYILYYIAGLVKSNDGRAVDKASILSSIRKGLRYDIGSVELMELIKREPEFDITRTDQERISFKNNPDSWKVIREKYSPENTKRDILVRVNMNQIELEKKLGENRVTIESPISGDDNIYKITIDKSRAFFHKLMNLYRTFRGSDKILGEDELVNELEKQMIDADAAYNRADMLYQMEIM